MGQSAAARIAGVLALARHPSDGGLYGTFLLRGGGLEYGVLRPGAPGEHYTPLGDARAAQARSEQPLPDTHMVAMRRPCDGHAMAMRWPCEDYVRTIMTIR